MTEPQPAPGRPARTFVLVAAAEAATLLLLLGLPLWLWLGDWVRLDPPFSPVYRWAWDQALVVAVLTLIGNGLVLQRWVRRARRRGLPSWPILLSAVLAALVWYAFWLGISRGVVPRYFGPRSLSAFVALLAPGVAAWLAQDVLRTWRARRVSASPAAGFLRRRLVAVTAVAVLVALAGLGLALRRAYLRDLIDPTWLDRAEPHQVRERCHAALAAGPHHDCCLYLGYGVGDASSIPVLIDALWWSRIDPDIVACPTEHCLAALRGLTGDDAGPDYESWRAWYASLP